jgi:hypothetical protein
MLLLVAFPLSSFTSHCCVLPPAAAACCFLVTWWRMIYVSTIRVMGRVLSEGTNRQLLPPNTYYWFLCSDIGIPYKPRLYPRNLNRSPRVLYVPVDAMLLWDVPPTVSSPGSDDVDVLGVKTSRPSVTVDIKELRPLFPLPEHIMQAIERELKRLSEEGRPSDAEMAQSLDGNDDEEDEAGDAEDETLFYDGEDGDGGEDDGGSGSSSK